MKTYQFWVLMKNGGEVGAMRLRAFQFNIHKQLIYIVYKARLTARVQQGYNICILLLFIYVFKIYNIFSKM